MDGGKLYLYRGTTSAVVEIGFLNIVGQRIEPTDVLGSDRLFRISNRIP